MSSDKVSSHVISDKLSPFMKDKDFDKQNLSFDKYIMN